MGTSLNDVAERRKEIMEAVNAREVRNRVRNMTRREQKEAVKSIGTDILFDEISSRCEKMNSQISQARKILRVNE